MKSTRYLPGPWAAASLLAASLYLVSMLLATGGRLSLPLDDAFIFFQYARQLVAGRPFQYNGGDAPSGGVTSLPTLLIDALGYAAGFRGEAMVVFSFLIGAAGLYLCLAAAHRLGRSMGLESAWWAPLFVIPNGPLVWGLFSGMDLPFYVASLLMTMASWAEEASAGSGRRKTILWGSLAAAGRAEGLMFGAVLALLLFIEGGNLAGRGAAGPLRKRLAAALPLAAGLVPGLVLLIFTGSWTPTSLQVKGALHVPGADLATWIGSGLEYFNSALRQIFLGFEGEKPARLQANNASGVLFYSVPLTFLLYLLGVLPAAARESETGRPGPGLLSAAAFLAGLASASLVVPRTWHWHRYLMPLYALILPHAALGLQRAVRLLSAAPGVEAGATALRRAGLGAYVLLALPGSLYFLVAFAQNSADIYFQQTMTAHWIRRSLPPGEKLAVNDAGALRYYGDRPVLDLEGLVTPRLTESRRHGTSSLFEALERLPAGELPGHLVVYPTWYDQAFLRPHRLVHSQRIFRQTIAGGNPMNVYQADWKLLNSGNAPSSPGIQGRVRGLRLADRLDVADLADEAAHRYSFAAVEGQYQGLLEILPGTDAGVEIMDGGRVVTGREDFRVGNLEPGRDVVMAIRSRSGFRIRVSIDGEDAGEWLDPGGGSSGWTESSFGLPGRLFRGRDALVRVEPAELHATAYSAFHYWFYQ